jgi:transposase-like protein
MGVRDIQLFDLRLDDIAQDRPFEPRYFALKCSIPIGTFTSVTVDSWNHFRHFIEAKHNVQTEICKIPNCKTHHAEGLGNSPETCKCTQCKEGFTLLPGPALEYDKCEESSWKVDITSIPKSLTSVADVEKLDWNLAFMSKGHQACFVFAPSLC